MSFGRCQGATGGCSCASGSILEVRKLHIVCVLSLCKAGGRGKINNTVVGIRAHDEQQEVIASRRHRHRGFSGAGRVIGRLYVFVGYTAGYDSPDRNRQDLVPYRLVVGDRVVSAPFACG